MYGNLIQLKGDLTDRAVWERLSIGSVGGKGAIDEARLQWMREHYNRLVSTLHPECRRRLRTRG